MYKTVLLILLLFPCILCCENKVIADYKEPPPLTAPLPSFSERIKNPNIFLSTQYGPGKTRFLEGIDLVFSKAKEVSLRKRMIQQNLGYKFNNWISMQLGARIDQRHCSYIGTTWFFKTKYYAVDKCDTFSAHSGVYFTIPNLIRVYKIKICPRLGISAIYSFILEKYVLSETKINLDTKNIVFKDVTRGYEIAPEVDFGLSVETTENSSVNLSLELGIKGEYVILETTPYIGLKALF